MVAVAAAGSLLRKQFNFSLFQKFHNLSGRCTADNIAATVVGCRG